MTPSADTVGTMIDVFYTQIQYTQTVLLNFNGLTWPHVSVANFVPNDPIPRAAPGRRIVLGSCTRRAVHHRPDRTAGRAGRLRWH